MKITVISSDTESLLNLELNCVHQIEKCICVVERCIAFRHRVNNPRCATFKLMFCAVESAKCTIDRSRGAFDLISGHQQAEAARLSFVNRLIANGHLDLFSTFIELLTNLSTKPPSHPHQDAVKLLLIELNRLLIVDPSSTFNDDIRMLEPFFPRTSNLMSSSNRINDSA